MAAIESILDAYATCRQTGPVDALAANGSAPPSARRSAQRPRGDAEEGVDGGGIRPGVRVPRHTDVSRGHEETRMARSYGMMRVVRVPEAVDGEGSGTGFDSLQQRPRPAPPEPSPAAPTYRASRVLRMCGVRPAGVWEQHASVRQRYAYGSSPGLTTALLSGCQASALRLGLMRSAAPVKGRGSVMRRLGRL